MPSNDSRSRRPSRRLATGKFSPPARAMMSSSPGTPSGAPGRGSSGFATAPTDAAALTASALLSARPASECHHGEAQPVQVVVDVEVAREAGAGVLGLVPGAVITLVVDQPCEPAFHGPCAFAERMKRDQRPRRLRRRAGPPADPGGVVVGASVLAPAAVRILDLLEPCRGRAQASIGSRNAAFDEAGERRAGSVDVVDPPAPEPGAAIILLTEEV